MRLSLLMALALPLALCLLATAGPALAGDPFEGDPPGAQWGGTHEFNGKLILLGADTSGMPWLLTEQIVVSDPRMCGVAHIVIDEFAPTVAGNLAFSGHWEMTNTSPEGEPGTWTADCAGLMSSGVFVGKPYNHLMYDSVATGTGAYQGQFAHLSSHWASGAWIAKGWIDD